MNRCRFALVLAFALLLLGGGAVLGQQPPIRIGVVYSFSGAGGTAGKEFNDVLALFQKQHGDTINGRKVEVIERDDGGIAPDNAKRLAQELIVQQHVDLLAGLIFTPNAVAVGTVSTQAKMPVFIVNATTSGIMAKNPYMSRYSMTATQVTVPLAQYAYKSGMRNMYVIFMDYGPGIDSGQTFENTFTAAGGKVLGEIRVPVAAEDFSAYLQRMKDAHPDGVYIFLNASGSGTAFLKLLRRARLEDEPRFREGLRSAVRRIAADLRRSRRLRCVHRDVQGARGAERPDRSGQDDGAREAAQVREPARSDRDRSRHARHRTKRLHPAHRAQRRSTGEHGDRHVSDG